MDDNTEFDEWTARKHVAQRLAKREDIYLVAIAALVLAWAATWVADKTMLVAGVDSMAWRYLLAIGVGYAAFLLCLKLWIPRWRNRIRLGEIHRDLVQAKQKSSETTGKNSSPEAWWYLFDPSWAFVVGGEGCAIIAIVLLVLLAAIGGGLYFFLSAESFFADIVLELLLAAGLFRGLRNLNAMGWENRIFKSTLPGVLLTLVVAELFCFVVHDRFPQAKTMMEAYQLYVDSPSTPRQPRKR
jgi:hypothetical protein